MLYGLEQYLRASAARFAATALGRRSSRFSRRRRRRRGRATIAEAINTRVAPEFNNRFVRVTRAPGVSGVSLRPTGRSQLRSRHACRRTPARGLRWYSAPGRTCRPDTPHDDQRYHARDGFRSLPDRTRQLARNRSRHCSIACWHLLGLLLPVLVVCAAGGGYLLVQRALRPVERMSQTAEQMSVQNLEARLPVLPPAMRCNACRCR